MELRLDSSPSGHRFVSVSDHDVLIGDDRHSTSVVVTPNKIIPGWPPRHLSELKAADLDIIIALRPELILIGTGATIGFPNADILQKTISAQIGIDFMDTRAACRTYNILSGEDRLVAVGIILEIPIADVC